MRIEIARWSSRNLRCPDIDLSLLGPDEKPTPILLLQMPNGTGKTTTLTMMRAAMSGRSFTPDEVMQLKRHDSEVEDGSFKLDLFIDSQLFTIEVDLDFVEKTAKYTMSHAGGGGLRRGFEPPSNVRRFLNDKFVNLFIFDGEFADQLLDRHKTKAGQAIDSMFQIYHFSEISDRASQYWDDETRSKGSKSETGLTRHQNQLQKISTQLNKLYQAKTHAENDLSNFEQELEELNQQLSEKQAMHKELSEKLEFLKVRKAETQQHVHASAQATLERFRDSHLLHPSFLSRLNDLRENLDRLKLPASTSKQFFDELLQEEHCICGRVMDESARAQVAMRADSYMGEDTSGFLNNLKGDVENFRTYLTHTEWETDATVDSLMVALEQGELADIELRSLNAEFAAAGGDVMSQLQEKAALLYGQIEKRKNQLEQLCRKPNDRDKDQSIESITCIAYLEVMKLAQERTIADISNTVQLREQVQLLKKILKRAQDIARLKIKENLRNQCNERLQSVLGRDPIFIEKIEDHLTLRNQSGASVGQTLSIGYTFLSTLLHRGQHDFPFVVDSPANPLDLEIRREVAKLVPDLCAQFVALTTSSEREGFTTTIERLFGDKTKFLTMFRRTPGTTLLEAQLPENGVSITRTGVLVDGVDFFNRFENVEDESRV